MSGATLVVGTAGHIDHGKTSLVRTLTGQDLDTLPEEQQRGITIALGFAPLDLPSGDRIAFVDVPGHERLVRTMISGATGVDAALLCVSAVDGVMPQTREHMDVLELLGTRQGVVAVTMADLVDEELLELAMLDVEDLLADTFLNGAEVIPFSSETGQGKEEILAALAGFRREELPETGPFRLPVDRSFSRTGFGTVVTGTAWSGTLKDGDTVKLLPTDATARVRGIEVHGASSDIARAGWRIALNLAGVAEVPRGVVIAQGEVPTPHVIDVRYQHLQRAAALKDGSAVRVLLGTAECMGKMYAGDELGRFSPGRFSWAQIRLEGPLPCLPGDRFIVRRTSPMETLGGGVVVDPWAPKMRVKRRLAHAEEVARLYGGDAVVWLERAGEDGLTAAERGARTPEQVGVELGQRWIAPRIVARLEGALLEAIASFHNEQPLALGAHRRELRRGRLAHLLEGVFDDLVDRLAAISAVELHGPLVCRTGFHVDLTPDQAAERERLVTTISSAGVTGISPSDLHAQHPGAEVAALLRLIEAADEAVQVPKLGWLSRGTATKVQQDLAGWFVEHDQLTPPQFKDLFGLTRKSAIPLLEWLDKQRFLVRTSDGTRLPGASLSR
jgi:selenocysteine-specific elongation factor